MDWAQVLAIVLPVMLAIVIGLFYSNRRFDDMNRKIDDLKTDLRGDIKEIRSLLVDFLKKEAGV